MPVNPNTGAQGLARARLAGNSALWRSITGAQRAGWSGLASSKNRTDALGQTYTMQGNQIFCSINNVRLLSGLAVTLDAPADTTPPTITSATITLTAASLSIAYTPTPMPAATYLAIYASPQRSAGRSYENDFRFLKLSAAAGVSPLVALSEYTAKFGVPVVGARIFFSLVSINLGFQSGAFITSAVVA